jgi:hypothetical protein
MNDGPSTEALLLNVPNPPLPDSVQFPDGVKKPDRVRGSEVVPVFSSLPKKRHGPAKPRAFPDIIRHPTADREILPADSGRASTLIEHGGPPSPLGAFTSENSWSALSERNKSRHNGDHTPGIEQPRISGLDGTVTV